MPPIGGINSTSMVGKAERRFIESSVPYYKEHPNNAVVKHYRGALDISYERL